MPFDLIFALRENAPGLFEGAFAVGVVASVSALGSFLVSAVSRRWFGTALLALALAAAAEPARALLVHRGGDYSIAAGERVSGSGLTRGGGRGHGGGAHAGAPL